MSINNKKKPAAQSAHNRRDREKREGENTHIGRDGIVR